MRFQVSAGLFPRCSAEVCPAMRNSCGSALENSSICSRDDRVDGAMSFAKEGVFMDLSKSFSRPDGGMLNGKIRSNFFIGIIVGETMQEGDK